MIFDTKVINVIRRTPDVMSFRFGAPPDFVFKPGQFMSVTVRIDGTEETKYLSISNSPTEKGYIECTKRITSSRFSKYFSKMKNGDPLRLDAPMGSFIFQGEYPKTAFLSGGIGITPIRSMCKYIADNKLPVDIVLIYGNDKKENIVFKDDFDIMAVENEKMKVVYTLTAPDVNDKSWTGRTGYVNEEMIRIEIPDYAERVFYTCGPPKMVEGMVKILKENFKLPQTQIKTENFVGY